MDVKAAKALLPLVNQPDQYDRLQAYVAGRIASLTEQVLVERNVDRIREIQGAVRELKRFQTLREETRHTANEQAPL